MDPLPSILNRRRFLATSAKAGLVLGAPGLLRASSTKAPSDTLNVAMVGFGRQGVMLHESMRNIPGIRVQAVCDIWEYSRKRGQMRVRNGQNGKIPNAYTDLDDMLANETGLDAAIIATPDFWHAPHAIRCMEAGLHVYCESMMAHTVDAARDIVRTSERTGKLCQIGHQHRSSSIYRYIRDRLLQQHEICGNIHNINSQWNKSRALSERIMWNPRFEIEVSLLRRYGYDDMGEFMNWRHHRKFTQGRLLSRTAHLTDLVHWIFDTLPSSAMISSDRDYYLDRENHDNLMCILEYEVPHGKLRAFHQSLTTVNEPEIRFEKFFGSDATLHITGAGIATEIKRTESGSADKVEKFRDLAKRGFLRRKPRTLGYGEHFDYYKEEGRFDYWSAPSLPPDTYELPGTSLKPALELHLINFFDAIRGRAKLNCDARTAFQSEAAIYWLHAAAESGETHHFTPEQLDV